MKKIHLLEDAGSFKSGWVVAVSDGLADEWINDKKAETAHRNAPEHKFKPGEYEEWLKGYKAPGRPKKNEK